jgi:hypothetical protein
MTAALPKVEAERNLYRRALETAQRDLRVIAGALAAALERQDRRDLQSVHGQADVALDRVNQALDRGPKHVLER